MMVGTARNLPDGGKRLEYNGTGWRVPQRERVGPSTGRRISMYLDGYKALCKNRSTSAEYPLDLLDGLTREFQKALDGGILGTTYILEKLDTLKCHVEWLDSEARKQFAATCEDDEADYTNELEARFS